MGFVVAVAGVALLVLVIWRGGMTWRFVAARLALLRAARANPAVTIERGLLFGPRLSIARGDHRIVVTPMSLGFLRDDPPWTWWWITTTTDVKRVSLYVSRRRDRRSYPIIPSQHLFASGDPEFDARHVSYDYDPDDTEKANAMTLLLDAEVQHVVRELLSGDSDDCLLGAHMHVSRHRDGLDLEALLTELQRVAHVADAIERAFTRRPYRD